MKKISVLGLCLGCLATVSTSHAIDLKQSKVTQVVNDVQIITAADQAPKTAIVDDIFSMPDILRTGSSSRAELIAKDETITRVGANTIFSFDPASRTIDLKQGSLLFHSPHGKGGGTIHTGSATASVLGTTLIVTTTVDGGMKVLDLEGSVEVNLDSKKKQKLSPGQMTFILPGGTELAPIIVFRLDELVRSSLLVHGFTKPITSMPLIQDQIDRQRKLIKAGRASDTGLLVGDSASPNQVEVLDPNTVQSLTKPGKQSDVQKALKADANMTGSSLTDPNIPTPPNRVFLDKPFSLAGNKFFAGQTFLGFAGRNINLNAPPVANNPDVQPLGSADVDLTVDMTPFASAPGFDFVAAKNINFAVSTGFEGLSGVNTLSFIGGEQITFAPNITVHADVGDLEFSTPGALTLDGVTFINYIGKVGLTSGSTIDLHNVDFIATARSYTAPDAINFVYDSGLFLGLGAPGGITINTDPSKGRVTLNALHGPLQVTQTSIKAHFLTLNSGDSILLDATGHTLTATGPGATANFTAPNIITVNNADLANYGVVNMAANTIVLANVNFGANSKDTLTSANHALASNPNTDQTVKQGFVNFIHGVTYGNVLVTAPSGFVNGNIPGTGITIQ